MLSFSRRGAKLPARAETAPRGSPARRCFPRHRPSSVRAMEQPRPGPAVPLRRPPPRRSSGQGCGGRARSYPRLPGPVTGGSGAAGGARPSRPPPPPAPRGLPRTARPAPPGTRRVRQTGDVAPRRRGRSGGGRSAAAGGLPARPCPARRTEPRTAPRDVRVAAWPLPPVTPSRTPGRAPGKRCRARLPLPGRSAARAGDGASPRGGGPGGPRGNGAAPQGSALRPRGEKRRGSARPGPAAAAGARLCPPAAPAVPLPNRGSAGGAKLYLGSPPAPLPRRSGRGSPHAPSIPPHPLPGGAAPGVPGTAAARSQAGLPGSGAAEGALVGNGRRGDGRLGKAFGQKGLGKARGLVFPDNKPQTSPHYGEDASRTGRRRSSRAATAPAGPFPGSCAGVDISVFEEIKKKKRSPILYWLKTSSALSQSDGQFCRLFTKCSLSSSLERVDQAK